MHTVLILGGGTAGLLTALTLKTKLPGLHVRVVHSPAIGIIGVGEGSTTDLPSMLHGYLRLDPAEFHREVRPTFKLGVRFLWGPRDVFHYTFTNQVTGRPGGISREAGFAAWEDFSDLDPNNALMHAGRGFIRMADGSPRLRRDLAYHMENDDFVCYLERCAQRAGVEITEGLLAHVEPGPQGVAWLDLASGERITADLYVDASGFRGEILRKAMGARWISYRDTLFCDRAVAGGWDRTTEPLLPYTTAETMRAGWCWQIEHDSRINRGYVYSSATTRPARNSSAPIRTPAMRGW